MAVTDLPISVLDRAQAWGASPDISARSVLATILGDTVGPLGGTVWLGDLFTLTAPFGFNERLVRTSMFRLAGEGWVANERVGRRSRYSLTAYGTDETEEAERRIYGAPSRPWDGAWTLVVTGGQGRGGPSHRDDPGDLTRRLRWRGFARMADGVHVRPNDTVAETRALLERLRVDPPPAVASARFDDLAPMGRSTFRAESGLAEAEDGYRRFVDRYRWVDDRPDAARGSGPADLDPIDAYTLRTMVIHDIRRARLRDPGLPNDLLAADWIGHEALDLAGRAYRSVTAAAWTWVSEVTGLTIDPTAPHLADRFAHSPPTDSTHAPTPTPTPADSTHAPTRAAGPAPDHGDPS